MPDREEADSVIREFDVYLGASAAEQKQTVDLVSYPLRPPWRPYDFSATEHVLHKPVVGRLQVDTALDGPSCGNFNSLEHDKGQQSTELKLQASVSQLPATFAAAFVRDNSIVLVPITSSWQLRPDLAHMDAEALAESAAAKAEAEEAAPVLTQVHGTMRRVENEKQQQQRLASYAHLEQQERREAWQKLAYLPADSDTAIDVLQRLSSAKAAAAAGPANTSSSPNAYLHALVPGALGQLPSSIPVTKAQLSLKQEPGSNAMGGPLTAKVQGYLNLAMGGLLASSPVIGLPSIRRALEAQSEQSGAWVRELPDADLHGLASAAERVCPVHASFVARIPGDPWRDMVLELLQAGKTVKKSDVFAAAQKRSVPLSESTYSRTVLKVLKELCDSRSSGWSLKPAA